MSVEDLPKVELHLHLEGAAPPDFIRLLAGEQGVVLNGVFDAQGHYAWADFAGFLDCYHRACEVLTGPDEFRRLVEAVLAKSAHDGVIYTELFIAPHICGGGDRGAWFEYLDALYAGAAAARKAHGIEARFVSTCIRNLGPEAARLAAALSAEAAGPMLTGFGMGGEERHLAAADFAPAFDIAREAGLGLTSHAGEICGPGSVRETLDHLRPARIGHGVRAIEDPALVARLAVEGVVLEVNPGSNVALAVCPGWAAHPIDRLRRAGVKVTVSTDDPPYFHTDMAHEYRMLANTFGWGEEVFRDLNLTAIDAAFCDEPTRAAIRARLLKGA
ncbi:adenosine deaminase [Rhodobacteraceae bacterium 2CG4]|uniref:Adenosine deaminase n=1 Tax=Halovulum marinum TaxID=2662447 RepID=A0A6L5Z4T7_9RHOB|nr:adenosine deaminase [Halovulum marinum]MSU91044.1 adenosine deaminase [Halovulum marinum]